jgi:hypothetical protein
MKISLTTGEKGIQTLSGKGEWHAQTIRRLYKNEQNKANIL